MELIYKCPKCGNLMYEFNRYTEKGIINKTFICTKTKCNKHINIQHIRE